jgi:hypothetical protein
MHAVLFELLDITLCRGIFPTSWYSSPARSAPERSSEISRKEIVRDTVRELRNDVSRRRNDKKQIDLLREIYVGERIGIRRIVSRRRDMLIGELLEKSAAERTPSHASSSQRTRSHPDFCSRRITSSALYAAMLAGYSETYSVIRHEHQRILH